jgi:hypothetical protein
VRGSEAVVRDSPKKILSITNGEGRWRMRKRDFVSPAGEGCGARSYGQKMEGEKIKDEPSYKTEFRSVAVTHDGLGSPSYGRKMELPIGFAA